jgi:AcrR family transcriptional regulator
MARLEAPAHATQADGTRVDPRADRSHITALEVARAILVEEGWDALTHLRVAERSGLHRATIYRHWPTPLALLHDVLAQESALAQITPTGDLRRDLTAALGGIHHELAERDFGRVLTALIDRAEWNPDIHNVKVTLAQEGLATIHQVLQTGVERGELVRRLDPATGVAQLVGPLLYRRLLSDEAISPDFLDTIVECFLTGYAARPPYRRTAHNQDSGCDGRH